MSAPRRLSALSHRAALATPDGEARLAEVPFAGKLVLRGGGVGFEQAVGSVLGVALPGVVLATASGGGTTVAWVGPDEWYVFTAMGAETDLKERLDRALGGVHAQVVDVTDYYTIIAISGARAREMLQKIATLDLHPRAFEPGDAAMSDFGRTVSLLRQTAADAYELMVRISMADYLWCLLAEAGHEWGLPLQRPKGEVALHLPHFGRGELTERQAT